MASIMSAKIRKKTVIQVKSWRKSYDSLPYCDMFAIVTERESFPYSKK